MNCCNAMYKTKKDFFILILTDEEGKWTSICLYINDQQSLFSIKGKRFNIKTPNLVLDPRQCFNEKKIVLYGERRVLVDIE